MFQRLPPIFAFLGIVYFGVLAPRPAAAADAPFEADRKAILSLAGDYHVTFDFKETVSFQPAYKLFPEKLSGGHETVRVIEDTGKVIRLQHILVTGTAAEPELVKHWREDWTYEPKTLLTYAGKDHWTMAPVPAAARAGAWAQTVWQTDDSPRYGGVGVWRHDHGVSRWMSDDTTRPLARRDAVRSPPYNSYVGTNRVSLTPTGWVHEQDNTKLGPLNGQTVTFAHEIGVNTYARDAAFPVAASEAYWGKTKGYWTAVRGAWDATIAGHSGVHVGEEAENGAVTGPALMDTGEDLADGKITEAAAISKARAVIAAEAARS